VRRFIREYLRSPANEPELSSLRNGDNVPIGINRMIVAEFEKHFIPSFVRSARPSLQFCWYSASTARLIAEGTET
jgi:hypothetical protein